MASGTIIWTSDGQIFFVPGELGSFAVTARDVGRLPLSREELDRAGMMSDAQMQTLSDTAGPGHVIAELRPVLLDDPADPDAP